MSSSAQAKWRPRIGSVWKQRDIDDLFRVRFTVIGFEGDQVIFRRSTDGEVFRRDADFWGDAMAEI